MATVKRLTAVAVAAAAVALAQPVLAQDEGQGGQQGGQAPENAVVAVVNDNEIRMSDVFEGIRELPQQYQQMPPQVLFNGVVEQLVNRYLMSEEGYANGLEESEEVQGRLAEVERRLVQEAWVTQEIEARMSDERIQEAYDRLVAEFEPAEEIRARHILVETEEEARTAVERLDAGEDFAALAQELSTGPSGEDGGDLGYFTRDVMVAPFADAAFELEPGSYTQDPVETQFGWHVILVEDRRPTEPPALEEVRGQLTQDAQQEIVQEIVDDLRAEAEITRYDLQGNEIDPDAAAPAAPAEGEEAAPAQ